MNWKNNVKYAKGQKVKQAKNWAKGTLSKKQWKHMERLRDGTDGLARHKINKKNLGLK